jgi:hypothetical protein
MKNFIKLTDLFKDKLILVNATLIQSIHEQTNGSYLIMSFGDNSVIHVKETPDQIMELIEKSEYFTIKNS